MRCKLLVLVLAATLVGCGGSDEADNGAAQVDQQLAEDNLIDNDLTAIDAVTGADANMAADVDPSTMNASGNESGDQGVTERPTPRSAAPARETPAKNEPADTAEPSPPATNTAESN